MVRQHLVPFAVLVFYGLLHSVSSGTINLCDEYAHPELDCTKGLVCDPSWPSKTGNYGDRDLVSRSNLIDDFQITFFQGPQPASQQNSTVANINIDTKGANGSFTGQQHEDMVQGQRVSKREATESCCRPTVECFEFIHTIKYEGAAYPGRLVIEDLEEWKRAECCMRDFFNVKPWCPRPPPRRSTFTWHKPPTCAEHN